ncbi:MAG: hypothetical protein R3247_12360 [Rhodothermales bacterium]|nr:hypothetical protein [Rhodothermales bacterium]
MKHVVVIALLLVFGLSAQTAHAQLGAGLKVQYGLDAEEVQVGGELHVPLGVIDGLTLVPALEAYLGDEPSVVVLNGNVHYAPPVSPTSAFRPYAGLGLAAVRVSVDDEGETHPGLNLIGGINFRAGPLTPFAQFTYRTGDASDTSIGGGLRFIIQ